MPTPGKYGRIGGRVLHALLAAMMIMAGMMKLAAKMPPEAIEKMLPGIRDNLMLIAVGEILTAILLLVPVTSSLGVLLTSGFWGGVICIHMAQGESYILPSVFLVLTWVGAYLRDPGVLYSFTRGSRSAPAVVAAES